MSNQPPQKKKSNPLAGCMLLVLVVLFAIYLPEFIARGNTYNPPRSAPASSPANTPLATIAPSATIQPTVTVEAHYYGERVVFEPELVTIPMGVKFYTCQRLDCQVFFITGEADEWLVTAFIGGEVVDDVGMWVVIDILGTEVFSPLVEAMPRTPAPVVTP